MFKPREIVHQTQKEMFHLISKQQALIHQTRGVFQLRSKHREVMHQKRERVFQLRSKNRKRGYKNDTHTIFKRLCNAWYTLKSYYLFF